MNIYCELNKATEDADLELIFSRFGRIESCDMRARLEDR